MERALIIMIRNPVKGKVKTRLAKDIGEETALDIYNKLLSYTNAVASEVQTDRFLFYSDVISRSDIFDNSTYKKYVQCNGNLGIRMDYAFSIPFKNEYRKVVMIGSDCPGLTAKHIEQAFVALEENDFVIGPASDGGYYLIGMHKWNRWIFENKNWSTRTLLEETKKDIQSRNGKLIELEILSDIDSVSDLNKYPGFFTR